MTGPTTFQPDKPVAGYYRMKTYRGGPWLPVVIWFGTPADPETGETLDRSLRWQARLAGREADVWEIWPSVAGREIDAAEYERLLGAPETEPNTPITPLHKLPSIF